MEIPDTYLVADLETTGFGKTAHIVQVGWCAVTDRKITHRGSVPLRCPDGVEISPGATAVHGYTWEWLNENGKDPVAVRCLALANLWEKLDKADKEEDDG